MATERTKDALEKLTPEQRSRVEAARARRRDSNRESPVSEGVQERVEQELGMMDTIPGTEDRASMEDVVAFRRFIMELRKLREHKGLSLDDVSKASGIDKAQLSRLESGKKLNPTVHTLMRYARAVGEPLGWCSASNTSSSIEEMVVVRVIRRLGLSPEEAVFRLATNISAAPPTRDAPSLHGYANPQGSVVISNLSSPASQENSGAARALKESDKR